MKILISILGISNIAITMCFLKALIKIGRKQEEDNFSFNEIKKLYFDEIINLYDEIAKINIKIELLKKERK